MSTQDKSGRNVRDRPVRKAIAEIVGRTICAYNGIEYQAGANEIPEALDAADRILAIIEAEQEPVAWAHVSGNEVLADDETEPEKERLRRSHLEVVTLAVCEQDKVILRPDQLYKFEVVEGCNSCESYNDERGKRP